jgi:hypothetical protein
MASGRIAKGQRVLGIVVQAQLIKRAKGSIEQLGHVDDQLAGIDFTGVQGLAATKGQ